MLYDMPYFMENKEWYYDTYDNKECPWLVTRHLTEKGKSIPEVVKSYEEYQQRLNQPDAVFAYNSMKEAEEFMRKNLKKEGLSQEEIDKRVKEWLEGEDEEE